MGPVITRLAQYIQISPLFATDAKKIELTDEEKKTIMGIIKEGKLQNKDINNELSLGFTSVEKERVLGIRLKYLVSQCLSQTIAPNIWPTGVMIKDIVDCISKNISILIENIEQVGLKAEVIELIGDLKNRIDILVKRGKDEKKEKIFDKLKIIFENFRDSLLIIGIVIGAPYWVAIDNVFKYLKKDQYKQVEIELGNIGKNTEISIKPEK